MTITWTPSVPPEIRAAAEPLIEKHAALVPTWCHELRLYYDPDLESAVAQTWVKPEYRFGNLTLTGHFLKEPKPEREDTIVHELHHLALMPMVILVQDIINNHFENDDEMKGVLQEEWRQRFEGAVCDLTRATLGGYKPVARKPCTSR